MVRPLKKLLGIIIIFTVYKIALSCPYGVEVWEGTSKSDALEKHSMLLSLGFGNVGVYYDNIAYQVIVGNYENAMTPLWIISKLPEIKMCGDIVSMQDKEPIVESLFGISSVNQIPPGMELISFKSSHLDDSVLSEDRLEIKQFEDVKTKSIAEMETFVDSILNNKTSDPIMGWACLRKAYLQYKKQDKVASENYFRLVADGTMPAVRRHRCEALMRLGFFYAGQKNKLASYQAFELMKRVTNDQIQKAIAQVQQAGIIMEVARGAEGGSGTLEDCRKACLKTFEYVSPAQAPQTCATAELMIIETWFYENNFQKTVELGIPFLNKYKNQTRETSMAMGFIGLALDRTGNYEQAAATIAKIFDMDFSEKGSAFGADGKPWDMKQKAAEWIIKMSSKQKDNALIERLSKTYQEYFKAAQ